MEESKVMSLTNGKEKTTNFRKQEVEGTPFTMVKQGKEVKIVAGQFLVSSKIFKGFKECKAYIDSKPYELIFNTAALMADMVYKHQTENNKQSNYNEC